MKKIILFALLALSVAGCKKVLEKPPLTSITPENNFKSGDDAESGIIACYDALQDDGYYGSSLNIMGEAPSDNVTTANGDLLAINKIQWLSSTAYPSRIYQFAFKGINRANSVLKYVPAITNGLGAERKNQILGEAYFLRALNYFNLVKCFGGVPIHIEPTESEAQTSLPRSSSQDVYKQIESDLSQAESLLPSTFGNQSIDRTRATKGSVNALQSRVFLYQMKWADAAAAASKVISNSNYGTGLSTPFNNLFPPKNKQESIFEIQYSGNDDGGFTLPDLILPAPPASYSFPKFNIPTDELIAYADTLNDIRFKRVGPVAGGISYGSVVYGGKGSGNDNGWFIYKWRNTNFFSSKDNYPVFRLAEMYLTYAEASNEQSGPTQNALDRLNAVRVRAGLPALTLGAVSTKKLFRDETDRQRRLELAFEGERWFDLVRYARQQQTDPTAVHQVNALTIIQQKRGTSDANYLLYPIPLNELNNNSQVTQNPGY